MGKYTTSELFFETEICLISMMVFPLLSLRMIQRLQRRIRSIRYIQGDSQVSVILYGKVFSCTYDNVSQGTLNLTRWTSGISRRNDCLSQEFNRLLYEWEILGVLETRHKIIFWGKMRVLTGNKYWVCQWIFGLSPCYEFTSHYITSHSNPCWVFCKEKLIRVSALWGWQSQIKSGMGNLWHSPLTYYPMRGHVDSLLD